MKTGKRQVDFPFWWDWPRPVTNYPERAKSADPVGKGLGLYYLVPRNLQFGEAWLESWEKALYDEPENLYKALNRALYMGDATERDSPPAAWMTGLSKLTSLSLGNSLGGYGGMGPDKRAAIETPSSQRDLVPSLERLLSRISDKGGSPNLVITSPEVANLPQWDDWRGSLPLIIDPDCRDLTPEGEITAGVIYVVDTRDLTLFSHQPGLEADIPGLAIELKEEVNPYGVALWRAEIKPLLVCTGSLSLGKLTQIPLNPRPWWHWPR